MGACTCACVFVLSRVHFLSVSEETDKESRRIGSESSPVCIVTRLYKVLNRETRNGIWVKAN